MKKTIFIDMVCYASIFKLWRLSKRMSMGKVYFANIVPHMKGQLAFYEKIVGCTFEQILQFSESSERANGVTIYELIQKRMVKAREQWLEDEPIKNRIRRFTVQHDISPDNFKTQLIMKQYFYLWRPYELACIALKLCPQGKPIFLFHRNPFSRWIRKDIKEGDVFFYSRLISRLFSLDSRKYYLKDYIENREYYPHRVKLIARFLIFWIADSINALIAPFFSRGSALEPNVLPGSGMNIGVELIQSRVRLNEINDLFYLKNSGIDPNTIVGFELENYDKDSTRQINELRIRRVKPLLSPLSLWSYLKNDKNEDLPMITANRGYGFSTLLTILQLWFPMVVWNESSWMKFQEIQFWCRAKFWISIYRRLNIRILMTMFDQDQDMPAKMEALRKLDGLYMTGHWTNYPFYELGVYKASDVLFTWSNYFVGLIFNQHQYKEIFTVGYPSDHYFEEKKAAGLAIRDQYPGKFIVSYFDNHVSHDIPMSVDMHLSIHGMFMDLLDRYPGLVIFLKPKRRNLFDEILQDIPRLKEYVKKGRIVLFLGDTPRIKAVPAEIGAASDLVIGLGISTAASESSFAGTVSYHLDEIACQESEFVTKGINKIVFTNIQDLKAVVCRVIEGQVSLNFDEYQKYYKILDPFLDGQAYKRTGFVIKALQEAMQRGCDSQDAIRQARRLFDHEFAEVDHVV
jgi:hypothetical protein